MTAATATLSWNPTLPEAGPRAAKLTGLEALMERYVEGDAAAFEELYREVSPRLFALLLRMTRDRASAEDLLQTVFTKVHRARGAYLQGAPVMPWLVAIARHAFYDQDRRRKTRREHLSDDGSVPEHAGGALGDQVEAADLVDNALGALPPKLRDAVLLTKLEGMSVAEAADVLGTTSAAIKLRVHRARKIIHDLAA